MGSSNQPPIMTKGRVAVVLAAAVALVGAAPPDGSSVPDSATIRDKVAAVAGPVPNTWHEIDETVSSDGTTTVEHDYVRGDDFRYVFGDGPYHSEYGLSKGQHWHQNENGQTVLDQPDPGLASDSDEETTTVRRVQTPVDAYVIETLNKAGYGTRQYVDPTLWRTVRRERLTANGTITTTYDDFRLEGGRTFAHHYHVDDRIDRTTEDTRIVAYDRDPVSEAEVAIPPPRRALVEFPAGVHRVTLPTQFLDSDIVLRVTINGRGLDFVLDTGASGILIDNDVAKQLGLTLHAPHSQVTAQRYTAAETIVPEMHVGALTMHDVVVDVAPNGWQEGPYVRAVGLMGFDFLAELGVRLDYQRQQVVVVPGSEFVPPNDPRTVPIDVRVGDGELNASVSVNGVLGEHWLLDTGADATFLIFDAFARRHPEAMRDEHNQGRYSTPVSFSGVGGEFDTRPYDIAKLQLGNLVFTDFIGYRVTEKGAYDWDSDGLIGTHFLRLFIVDIDYLDSRVYLTPTDDTKRREKMR